MRSTGWRGALGIALLLAAIGGAAAWFLSDDRGASHPTPPSPGPDEVAVGSSGTDSRAASPIHVEPFRESREAELTTDPALGLLVRVVSRPIGLPVAGADVWIVSAEPGASEVTEEPATGTQCEDDEARIGRRGRHARTNAQGEVLLRWTADTAQITARGEGGYDCDWWLPSADRVVTLRLAPDRELRVHVVNSDGTPAPGVPVALRCEPIDEPHAPRPAPPRSLARRVSRDEDGTATFRNVGRLLARVRERSRYFLTIDMPFGDSPHLPLDHAAAFSGDVTLVAPPHGAVTVRVTSAASGAPVERARVFVYACGDDASHPYRLTDRDGVAEFRFVPTGQRLRIVADAELRPASETTIDGRPAGGHAPRVELTLAETRRHRGPAIEGRALDEHGAPLVGATISAITTIEHPAERSASGRTIRTGPDGQFLLAWTEVLRPDARWLELLVPDRERSGAAWARCLLPAGQSTIALGDVTFTTPPLVASGIVRDDAGRPVPRATLSVAERVPGTRGSPSRQATRFDIHAAADSTGHFTIQAPLNATADAFELRASANDIADATPVMCAPGATGVTLRVTRGATIRGTLLLDRNVPHHALEVLIGLSARGSGSEAEQGPWIHCPVSPFGDFRLGPLPDGTATIKVMQHGDGEPLVVVSDIRLAWSAPPDPRLDPIDLRDRLKLVRVAVVDPAGAPIEGAQVVPAPFTAVPGGAKESDARAAFPEPAAVLVRPGENRLAAIAPGRRMTMIAPVTDEVRVVLAPALRVRLRLAAPSATAARPLVLSAALRFRETPPSSWWDPYIRTLDGPPEGTAFDSDGICDCTVARVGSYQVVLRVNSAGDQDASRSAVEVLPSPIVVEDSPTLQTFTLAVDPATVRALVERVHGR